MIQSISGWTTSGASLLILSAVSIDRLLALTLHLRYHMIVTVPRVFQTAVCLWIFTTAVIMLRFWIRNWIIFPVVITLSTFLITTTGTFKIFQIVRRHRRQISQQQQNLDHLSQSTAVNLLKCRKSAVTVLYVYGLFLIFYFPFCVTMLTETFIGYTITVKIAYDYATTVVFINSFLNPFVYCWRVREIRCAVKKTLRKSLEGSTTQICHYLIFCLESFQFPGVRSARAFWLSNSIALVFDWIFGGLYLSVRNKSSNMQVSNLRVFNYSPSIVLRWVQLLLLNT